MIANQNIQDEILEKFKNEESELTVFLLNGFQMKGTVAGFDQEVVNLLSQGKNHLIYKHAISTFVEEA
ncbi:RNA chaperone Hfq [Staphylococcus massiliensis]|uniref:RNA-binding protein Hfq n=1 Tax=Staphylococcus massiliensis S46 TaxID=1229783 RepID=K9AWR0_9STAP|nr:RNA chaperone Hfq [Staphylococcus massiliensis]EKU50536.1 RNA chaperone Hfq [Staphylococcus massiliensis S46]MCG3398693.1 RNA chaperone Hfq [Staphylococcus massiliensis]MCG3401254.1 RNA chaperone Hfq [Staphylococcus massiliensis]MCG3412569.1 RNA chaperone Hfq [Staphylococcus massiliensis]PNZ99393.1 RNA chaperone Hfq [Staphylococcus massiliensis CCUG 55927]